MKRAVAVSLWICFVFATACNPASDPGGSSGGSGGRGGGGASSPGGSGGRGGSGSGGASANGSGGASASGGSGGAGGGSAGSGGASASGTGGSEGDAGGSSAGSGGTAGSGAGGSSADAATPDAPGTKDSAGAETGSAVDGRPGILSEGADYPGRPEVRICNKEWTHEQCCNFLCRCLNDICSDAPKAKKGIPTCGTWCPKLSNMAMRCHVYHCFESVSMGGMKDHDSHCGHAADQVPGGMCRPFVYE